MLITFTRADIENLAASGKGYLAGGMDARTMDRVLVWIPDDAARVLISRALRGKDLAADVDPGQVRERTPGRQAVVRRNQYGTPSPETVEAYLPGNYQVVGATDAEVRIAGWDYAGWGLDSYVLPRLASGLIWAEEVPGGH